MPAPLEQLSASIWAEPRSSQAAFAEGSEPVEIRQGTPEDVEEALALELELVKTQNGMHSYSKITTDEHKAMMKAGLFKLLLAVSGGRVVGFVLYTQSYQHQLQGDGAHAGYYVQSLYVDPTFRRRQIGQSLLSVLSRTALASGCVFLKLLLQGSNESALALYGQMGFELMNHAEEKIGFFEVWVQKFVASTLQAGVRELPEALGLQMRPCEPAFHPQLKGWQFALSSSECGCSMVGTASLTYCMWEGCIMLADMQLRSAETCAARPSGCRLARAGSVKRLLGRLALSLEPQPKRLWCEASREQALLQRSLINNNMEDLEGGHDGNWVVCCLRGDKFRTLAERQLRPNFTVRL